jgi:hypothetical protein
MINTTETTSRFETSRPVAVEAVAVDVAATPRTFTWWGAIVAGVVSAIALQAFFAVLGTAIGLTIAHNANDVPEQGIGLGAGLWWLITGLISLYVGGWVAGRLTPSVDKTIGAMHGFLTWCTVTVISAILVAMAGGALLGGGLSAASNVVARNDTIVRPNSAGLAARSERDALRNDSRNDSSIDDRTASPGSTPDDTVQAAKNDAQSLKNDARNALNDPDAKRAADKAAKATAAASWWACIGLALGATVTSLGGSVGASGRRLNHHRYRPAKP